MTMESPNRFHCGDIYDSLLDEERVAARRICTRSAAARASDPVVQKLWLNVKPLVGQLGEYLEMVPMKMPDSC